MGMRIRRYFLLGTILLLILGVFLGAGLMGGRRIMLGLMKEQARSFLSVVASTQENLIFAEARLEDELIDKLIGACTLLHSSLTKRDADNVRQSFGLHSIAVFDRIAGRKILVSGAPVEIGPDVFTQAEPISFSYFDFGGRTMMRFTYVLPDHSFQVELSADDIRDFRREVGINKVITQIAGNPMVRYLVLQDEQGIIFATPNVRAISRIDDDPVLSAVARDRTESSRITEFDDQAVLEMARAFTVENELVGIFRIGISLDSYHTHVRQTAGQLIALFVILFGAGFVLFLLFMNYQSYSNIRELFDKTLGAIEDGVLLVDHRGSISAANDMFVSISGFGSDLLVGNAYGEIFADDPFEVGRVMAEKRKMADEKTIFNKNIRYTTYPLIDDRQRVSGAILIIHDVTKIREFEKEKQESERLVFLGNLVANLAHEIKNPLNGLSIGTQRLLKEYPGSDPDYARITKSLKHEIDALNKIVNDFLVLARPRMKEKTAFRVAALLGDMMPLIEDSARERDIKLRKQIEADAQLIGQPDDLRRAILNVLLNAIDAVAGVEGRERIIDVRLNEREGALVLTIADNGVGMDEEERSRVFNPYFSTKKSGTGLGLYIAQKIVKDHGGDIRITSRKNEGTVFELAFPS